MKRFGGWVLRLYDHRSEDGFTEKVMGDRNRDEVRISLACSQMDERGLFSGNANVVVLLVWNFNGCRELQPKMKNSQDDPSYCWLVKEMEQSCFYRTFDLVSLNVVRQDTHSLQSRLFLLSGNSV